MEGGDGGKQRRQAAKSFKRRKSKHERRLEILREACGALSRQRGGKERGSYRSCIGS